MPFLHCHISGSGEAAFLPLKWGWKFGTDRFCPAVAMLYRISVSISIEFIMRRYSHAITGKRFRNRLWKRRPCGPPCIFRFGCGAGSGYRRRVRVRENYGYPCHPACSSRRRHIAEDRLFSMERIRRSRQRKCTEAFAARTCL